MLRTLSRAPPRPCVVRSLFLFIQKGRQLALIFKETLIDYKNGNTLGVRQRPLLATSDNYRSKSRDRYILPGSFVDNPDGTLPQAKIS
ncbi:MAG: hypothetical protein RLZZ480_862 [Candidatus Parcubacteria bacterium]